MKVGVFHPNNKWILSTIARKICAADPDHFYDLRNYDVPDPSTTHFYFVDIQNCWHTNWTASGAVNIGMFTHLDRDDPVSFRAGWDKLDGVVHMCKKYHQMFLDHKWYAENRMTVITPGDVSHVSPLPLRIGVCQRGGFPGKGDGFLQGVLHGVRNRNLINLTIKGSGWDKSSFPTGFDDLSFDEDETYNSYEVFYKNIDYLLIPSLWEGGPMALLEALAYGIPIIAADVGFVKEFTDARSSRIFEAGDKEQLISILNQKTADILARSTSVSQISYKRYTNSLRTFLERTF